MYPSQYMYHALLQKIYSPRALGLAKSTTAPEMLPLSKPGSLTLIVTLPGTSTPTRAARCTAAPSAALKRALSCCFAPALRIVPPSGARQKSQMGTIEKFKQHQIKSYVCSYENPIPDILRMFIEV